MKHRARRRELVVAAVIVTTASALAAALALTGGRPSAFTAKQLVTKVTCRAGFVAEGDKDAACVRIGSVEGPIETFTAAAQRMARESAPFDTVAPGAYANSLAQRGKKPKTGNAWAPVGNTPLYANSPDYAGSDPVLTAGPSQLGWVKLSGRINAFGYDPARSWRIFAAPATGGVFESTDGGSSWRSIGDGLPSQSMGGLAYSTANGGTIVAGTGDNAVGGVVTPSGLGVYASRNDGASWAKATGIPDGLTTYKVAVDPNNANVDYVATSRGLLRSTDDGVSYVNVNLPTGTCSGNTTTPSCDFANTVSDVAIQQGTGGVIAAVGWAYGQRVTKSGYVMAPQNGIYT